MLRVDPWLTMDQAICRHVRSPQLRQLLGRFATCVGARPYLAPATLSVIAHVELTGGVWYPHGGIYRMAPAHQPGSPPSLGVKIRCQTPVRSHSAPKTAPPPAWSRPTESEVPASAVVANIDVATVYDRLLPPDLAPARRRALCTRENLLLWLRSAGGGRRKLPTARPPQHFQPRLPR
jgi:phytoene dehydrogenase-like protein